MFDNRVVIIIVALMAIVIGFLFVRVHIIKTDLENCSQQLIFQNAGIQLYQQYRNNETAQEQQRNQMINHLFEKKRQQSTIAPEDSDEAILNWAIDTGINYAKNNG